MKSRGGGESSVQDPKDPNASRTMFHKARSRSKYKKSMVIQHQMDLVSVMSSKNGCVLKVSYRHAFVANLGFRVANLGSSTSC